MINGVRGVGATVGVGSLQHPTVLGAAVGPAGSPGFQIIEEVNLRSDTYSFDGPSEFIPGFTQSGQNSFVDVRDQISTAGDYSFSVNGVSKALYSFNYNRSESDISTLTTNELRDQFGTDATIIDNIVRADLSTLISQDVFGKPLWKWCLSLSLLFLMIETILLRFWK